MKNEMLKSPDTPHNVIIEGRGRISISGVLDVESFDENEIILDTSCGSMFISGEDMRVEKLSIETGDTVVEGHIICIEYNDKKAGKQGFWSKLF